MGMAIAGVSSYAEVPSGFRLPQGYDPLNLNYSFTPEQYRALAGDASVASPRGEKRGLMREIKHEGTEAPQYLVAAQTFHKDYVFNYEGGAVTTYDIGLRVDGDKVTISNFFNLAAQSTEWNKGEDWDVVGTYDAEAHTVTIPTLTADLESATICGLVGGAQAVLMSGTVNADGQMAPSDELVFDVVGDFESLTTDMNFGIGLWYDWYGGIMGFQTLYRRFEALIPGDEPKLLAFNNSFEFSETFPETDSRKTVTVVNVSGVDVDYAVNVEADDNAFTVSPMAGVIDAKSVLEYTLTLNSAKAGDYEGLASIVYEGVNENPSPIDILMFGSVVDYPDYSPIVKSGDFKFTTGYEFPFTIQEVEGNQVAHSGLDGRAGSSNLTVKFTVPENNIGTLSWKGMSTNLTFYSNACGLFVDNLDTPHTVWTGVTDIADAIELTPGEHTVRFQYDAVTYTGEPKNGLYLYDLELVNTPADAVKAVVETPEVDLGSFLIRDGNPVVGESKIVIRNKGLEPLSIQSVSSSDNSFAAGVPDVSAGLLEAIEIPVTFKASEDGSYATTMTIGTSAGEFTADVKALVRRMADFSPVVTEGMEYVTSIDTDDVNPFTVENGVAYNVNSGMEDNKPTESWFQINYTVPEGKAAYISWDGHCYTDVTDMNSGIYDIVWVEYQHPMNSGCHWRYRLR